MLLAALIVALQQPNTVIGSVRNRVTGDAIRVAVVRIAGTSTSTITDDDGRFRIAVPAGAQALDVRRIGFQPRSVPITGPIVNVDLDPIAVTLGRVVVTAEDDFARRIVVAAIARKQSLRGSLHDYRYDGEVRLTVRDLNKPADSASSVMAI